MVASLFAPQSLPTQLDQVVAELRAVRSGIDLLARTLAAQGETPESEVIVITISSASLPNAWYATSDQLRIVAVDFWSDTNGLYAFTVENDQSIRFRTNANVKQRVIDPPGRYVVPRGNRIGFTSPGSALFTAAGAWESIIYAYSGQARGRQNAG